MPQRQTQVYKNAYVLISSRYILRFWRQVRAVSAVREALWKRKIPVQYLLTASGLQQAGYPQGVPQGRETHCLDQRSWLCRRRAATLLLQEAPSPDIFIIQKGKSIRCRGRSVCSKLICPTLDYRWRVKSQVVVYGGVACEAVSSLVANYIDMTWAKDLRMLSTENGRYMVAFKIPFWL